MQSTLNALLAALLLGCAFAAHAAPTVTAPTAADPARHVATARYDAAVAPDGCLTNLKVGGTEFLGTGIDISRGVYLFSGGVAKLPNITQPSDAVVLAQGDAGSLQYTFTDDTITLAATNHSAGQIVFYIVANPNGLTYADANGAPVALPVTDSSQTTTFYCGTAKVQVAGGDKRWGWTSNAEVIEADIAPGATRTLTLTVSPQTADEIAKMKKAAGPDPLAKPDFNVLSPVEYEVFQRRTRLAGTVRLAGSLAASTDKIDVRLTGTPLEGRLTGAWQSVPTDAAALSYYGEVPVPAGGWYAVDVRDTRADKTATVVTVVHVGVGEVFVSAGQSNSTNYGQAPTQETSGMVANFTGATWRLADDPQQGVHDNSAGGSLWPSFGDAMVAKYHVPIGVAPTGYGGTSVTQWQPGGDLFNFTMARILQLGPHGFRALLWHQGEADTGMDTQTYARDLARTIAASKAAAGWDFPWFVAQVSYHDPTNNSFPSTRDGQKMLWDLGIALPGPDTDTLTGDSRYGIHLSVKGLKEHGELWAAQVGPYLDRVLAASGR